MKAYKAILFLVLVIISVPVLAQMGSPSGPPAAPIDGGLSLLLAAGGAYGLKKIMNKK